MKKTQYAVKCVEDGRYYNEDCDGNKDSSLDNAVLWKTLRGARDTCEAWGCALIPKPINVIVTVEVVETRKVKS